MIPPTLEEAMIDRLVAEHERDEHLWSVYLCPKCQEELPPRVQCQFCGSWFEPVPERLPGLTCERDWLEIEAGLKKTG